MAMEIGVYKDKHMQLIYYEDVFIMTCDSTNYL